MLEIPLLAATWLALAFAAGAIAESKGRSTLAWFAASLVLPIVSLLLVAAMPTLLRAPALATSAVYRKHYKTCGECAEPVLKAARKCKHCGGRLQE